MPQSLAQVYLHLAWSTKNRVPFLKDQALREEMHSYLAGACKNMDSPLLKVGGVEDHVHVSCRLSRKISMSDLVRGLKKESSSTTGRKIFKEEFRRLLKKYNVEYDEKYIWN